MAFTDRCRLKLWRSWAACPGHQDSERQPEQPPSSLWPPALVIWFCRDSCFAADSGLSASRSGCSQRQWANSGNKRARSSLCRISKRDGTKRPSSCNLTAAGCCLTCGSCRARTRSYDSIGFTPRSLRDCRLATFRARLGPDVRTVERLPLEKTD